MTNNQIIAVFAVTSALVVALFTAAGHQYIETEKTQAYYACLEANKEIAKTLAKAADDGRLLATVMPSCIN